MSQIKEIAALGTIASIRKATQDSLKPVVEEIQKKLLDISNQNAFLASKIQNISTLEKKLNKSNQQIRYLQAQLLQFKQNIQMMKFQQEKNKIRDSEKLEETKESITTLKTSINKQNTTITNITQKTNTFVKDINITMQSMKKRQETLQSRFKNISQKVQSQTHQSTRKQQKMNQQFQQLQLQLKNQVKDNIRRMKLLDLYQSQKQQSALKIRIILQSLQTTVKQPQFNSFKQINRKNQNRVVEDVNKIIQQNLSQKTKEMILMIPDINNKLKHCLAFQNQLQKFRQQIKSAHKKISQTQIKQIERNNITFEDLYSKISVINHQIKEMKGNISKALGFQGQMNIKLDAYTQQIKMQLREENYKKSRQLYQEIKVTFADKTEEIKLKQLQNIVNERKRLTKRADEIQDLGNKISQKLSNFAYRITKCKSDQQLFQNMINKQMLQVDNLKQTLQSNTSVISQTLSQIFQAIIISQCIQIQKQSTQEEQIAFSTISDGVLFQKYHCKKAQKGNLIYRRKLMNGKQLKRALMTALIGVYDQLIMNNNCLQWHKNKPSHFFSAKIEPSYNIIKTKLQSAIHSKQLKEDFTLVNQRQTIMNSFENDSNIRTVATHRSRRKPRYQSSQIFGRKSARSGKVSQITTIRLQ